MSALATALPAVLTDAGDASSYEAVLFWVLGPIMVIAACGLLGELLAVAACGYRLAKKHGIAPSGWLRPLTFGITAMVSSALLVKAGLLTLHPTAVIGATVVILVVCCAIAIQVLPQFRREIIGPLAAFISHHWIHTATESAASNPISDKL